MCCLLCHAQTLSDAGEYGNGGQLLLAVAELLSSFEDYVTIPRIASLVAQVHRFEDIIIFFFFFFALFINSCIHAVEWRLCSIRTQLRACILREFEDLTEGKGNTACRLAEACALADALGADVREQLLGILCR